MSDTTMPQGQTHDLYLIEVSNWKKFNPRADRANFTWFRMENNFFHDQSVFFLNNEQKLIYLFILCEISKKNSESVKLRCSYVSAVMKLSPELVRNTLKFLENLELIKATFLGKIIEPEIEKPSLSRHDDVTTPALRPATNETNETNVTRRTGLTKVRNTQAPSSALWEIYKEAFEAKYKTTPPRNAKVNSQLCQLLKRLPEQEIPDVIRFYLTHPNPFYVNKMHGVSFLLSDCEKLYNELKSGVKVIDFKTGMNAQGKYLTATQRRMDNNEKAFEDVRKEFDQESPPFSLDQTPQQGLDYDTSEDTSYESL